MNPQIIITPPRQFPSTLWSVIASISSLLLFPSQRPWFTPTAFTATSKKAEKKKIWCAKPAQHHTHHSPFTKCNHSMKPNVVITITGLCIPWSHAFLNFTTLLKRQDLDWSPELLQGEVHRPGYHKQKGRPCQAESHVVGLWWWSLDRSVWWCGTVLSPVSTQDPLSVLTWHPLDDGWIFGVTNYANSSATMVRAKQQKKCRD